MQNWRLIQKKTFTSIDKVAEFLELDEHNRKRLLARKDFPLLLPYSIAQKIPKNSLEDPLSLQFLPLDLENCQKGYSDPVGDNKKARSSALLHKYDYRALLLCTACAMHCRYCFRQNYDYTNEVDQGIDIIESDPSIKEVILSGGDPLSMSDKRLKEIVDRLDAIDHVKIIRFHSRFLVGIPERISESFLQILQSTKKQIFFLVHINCVEELDEYVIASMKSILRLSIPVMTQTVLLRGVNDSFNALFNLFDTLIGHGIIPYYLHQLDQVKGSSHFEVSNAQGRELILKLRESLPGYAVPRFVQEISGEKSKTLIL